jgi:hypothetical protein
MAMVRDDANTKKRAAFPPHATMKKKSKNVKSLHGLYSDVVLDEKLAIALALQQSVLSEPTSRQLWKEALENCEKTLGVDIDISAPPLCHNFDDGPFSVHWIDSSDALKNVILEIRGKKHAIMLTLTPKGAVSIDGFKKYSATLLRSLRIDLKTKSSILEHKLNDRVLAQKAAAVLVNYARQKNRFGLEDRAFCMNKFFDPVG